jgi:hypothetical protein
MSFPAPPVPVFRPDQSATTTTFVRYEDVAQDGRIMPIALPPGMSGLWHGVLRNHPGQRSAVAKGVLPILTRMTLHSLDQPIRIDRPIESRAGFELTRDGDGDDARIFMNVWAEISGAGGRIGSREPGPLAVAGRLFSEHTFTRPFAPPDQRRVTRLDVEGYPALPETLYRCPAAATASEPPDGSGWIDELADDPAEIALTLDQTDSNQHVNSLVYIRAFLDAAQRRLASGGHSLKVRSRAVDIAYRKPCFAGDRLRAQLRLFDGPDGLGAAGTLTGTDGKPRCHVRVIFGQ